MPLRIWAVASVLLLTACNQAAPSLGVKSPPLGTLTDRSVADAEAAAVAELEQLGFTLNAESDPGFVWGEIAHGAPAEWFECDRVTVHDRDSDRNRMHWADPEDLAVQVAVRLSELGDRTSVTLSPRFTGTYLDQYMNLTFQRACATAGVLEPAVLGAVGGG